MIDEKKLIEIIRKRQRIFSDYEEGYTELDNIISHIKSMPKIGEWIPVSEKLPDTKSKPYKLVLIQTKTSMCVGSMNAAGQWFGEDGTGWGAELKDEVIAWMPLPHAYKEEVEE